MEIPLGHTIPRLTSTTFSDPSKCAFPMQGVCPHSVQNKYLKYCRNYQLKFSIKIKRWKCVILYFNSKQNECTISRYFKSIIRLMYLRITFRRWVYFNTCLITYFLDRFFADVFYEVILKTVNNQSTCSSLI